MKSNKKIPSFLERNSKDSSKTKYNFRILIDFNWLNLNGFEYTDSSYIEAPLEPGLSYRTLLFKKNTKQLNTRNLSKYFFF